jgi:hypothetical protein
MGTSNVAIRSMSKGPPDGPKNPGSCPGPPSPSPAACGWSAVSIGVGRPDGEAAAPRISMSSVSFHHWHSRTVAMPHRMWTGRASFQRCRSIGRRLTRRKISGVRIAHGSQSLRPGRIALTQRFWVLEAASMPREQATIPQQRKLRIHALAIGGMPVHIRLQVAVAVFIAVEARKGTAREADGHTSDVSIHVRAPSAF